MKSFPISAMSMALMAASLPADVMSGPEAYSPKPSSVPAPAFDAENFAWDTMRRIYTQVFGETDAKGWWKEFDAWRKAQAANAQTVANTDPAK